MKRIGLSLTHLDPSRTGGAETYCRALVRGLVDAGSPYNFVLFVGRGHEAMPQSSRVEVVECEVDPRRPRRRIVWEQTRLPGILRKQNLSLVHFPYGTPPIGYAGPSVVTIHDTVRLQTPGYMSLVERWYRHMVEHAIVRRRHAVIMVSRADLSVFSQRMGLAEDHGHVVPLGVEAESIADQPAPLEDRVNELLWVGRAYPSKNLKYLLHLHAGVRVVLHDPPRLRLIGLSPAEGRSLRRDAERLGIADAVEMQPPVRQDALASFYRRARLLVYPSLQESFGLPIVESLAAGTPVVCSQIPALVELYPKGVTHCPLSDPDPWIKAISRLLKDADHYRQCAEDGLRLVRQHYTWDRTVERTLDVYHRLTD